MMCVMRPSALRVLIDKIFRLPECFLWTPFRPLLFQCVGEKTAQFETFSHHRRHRRHPKFKLLTKEKIFNF